MAIIHYKYQVGDKVKFKDKFTNPTCGCAGREGEIVEITGLGLAYNNHPSYYINGDTEGVYAERVFEGRVLPTKFFPGREESQGAITYTHKETKCDTEDSGESENLWEVISELSDIRAGCNLFSAKEQKKYHALSVAINKLRKELVK